MTYMEKLALDLQAVLQEAFPDPEAQILVELVGTPGLKGQVISLQLGPIAVQVSEQTSPEWGYAHLTVKDTTGNGHYGYIQRDGTLDTTHGANYERYFNLEKAEDVELLVGHLKQIASKSTEVGRALLIQSAETHLERAEALKSSFAKFEQKLMDEMVSEQDRLEKQGIHKAETL